MHWFTVNVDDEWWPRLNALVSINEVGVRRARLLLGWVTVCGQMNHLSK